MSKWLDDTLALVATITNGSAGDPATTKAVADLNTRLSADEADDAEVKQVVAAMAKQLANAPAPATPVTAANVAA